METGQPHKRTQGGVGGATHMRVTTLIPIAAAPAAPPPRALLRDLSRISWVVGGGFGEELDMLYSSTCGEEMGVGGGARR